MYLKLDGQLMADLPWPSCTRPTCGDKQRLEKVPRPDTSGSHRTFGQPWPQWTARCGFAPHRKSCTWWIIPKFESVTVNNKSAVLFCYMLSQIAQIVQISRLYEASIKKCSLKNFNNMPTHLRRVFKRLSNSWSALLRALNLRKCDEHQWRQSPICFL